MESIAHVAKTLPVDADDLDITIAQLTIAIRHNIALLHGLIDAYRPSQHATLAQFTKELTAIAMPDFVDVGESSGALNQHFLQTRMQLWGCILRSPDPRRAFVRWLKHLDDVTSGRLPCSTFQRLFHGG